MDDAQNICTSLMDKSLQYDPENPQTLQTLASILISMQQPEDAKARLQQSLALWMPGSEDEEEQGDQGEAGPASAMELPPYEFRINTAKLLIELGELDTALRVLDQLLSEDDNIMQVGKGGNVEALRRLPRAPFLTPLSPPSRPGLVLDGLGAAPGRRRRLRRVAAAGPRDIPEERVRDARGAGAYRGAAGVAWRQWQRGSTRGRRRGDGRSSLILRRRKRPRASTRHRCSHHQDVAHVIESGRLWPPYKES